MKPQPFFLEKKGASDNVRKRKKLERIGKTVMKLATS